MSSEFRVGSFNCENLFSRATLLNFDDNSAAAPLLSAAEQLRTELGRAKYDAAKILALYKQVEKYVAIRENKGKLFKGRGAKRTLVAKGVGDWQGSLEFGRDMLLPGAQENTARVVKAVNADVLCVIEVEDRRTLAHFGAAPVLGKAKYPHSMLIDGNDERGIDVGLLSRRPIGALRSHIDDRAGKSRIFSRDCLEVSVALDGSDILWLLVNHLKSQGYGTPAKNDARRRQQAERVAQILAERYDLTRDLVLVAGDFNAAPDSDSLAPLLSVPHLHNLITQQRPVEDAWTCAYRNQTQQLDYLLVSELLHAALVGIGIERRGMWDVEKLTGGTTQRFDTITQQKESASDHAAIYADFRLP